MPQLPLQLVGDAQPLPFQASLEIDPDVYVLPQYLAPSCEKRKSRPLRRSDELKTGQVMLRQALSPSSQQTLASTIESPASKSKDAPKHFTFQNAEGREQPKKTNAALENGTPQFVTPRRADQACAPTGRFSLTR